MTRDTFYFVFGVAVFVVSALILYFVTEMSIVMILITAGLLSLASDILIVFDNDRRNRAPDAKVFHRNELVGELATVTEDFTEHENEFTGRIETNAESWKARCSASDLVVGDRVKIIDRCGMTLIVTRTEIPPGKNSQV